MPPRDAPSPDHSGLQAWVGEYGPALRRYFQKRVGPTEAEDLVQDVFLAMQSRASDDDVEHPRAYLFRVAANVLARRRFRPISHAATADPRNNLVEEISPERLLLGRERIEQVVAAIQNLPPRARTALMLHRFEEITYPAVARRMGISVSAVERLISRALKQLTEAMRDRP